MPVWSMSIIVIIGCVALIWRVYVTLRAAKDRFADDQAVVDAWRAEHPAEAVRTVLRARSGTSALVETDRGSGMIWKIEAGHVAVPLTPASLAQVRDTHRGLIVEFAEANHPRAMLALTGAEAASWTAYLSRFRLN